MSVLGFPWGFHMLVATSQASHLMLSARRAAACDPHDLSSAILWGICTIWWCGGWTHPPSLPATCSFHVACSPDAVVCALDTVPLCCRGSLADGHVCIVPAEHVASGRRTDEAVWTELRNFKKSLLQMFMQQVRTSNVLNLMISSALAAASVHAAGAGCMHVASVLCCSGARLQFAAAHAVEAVVNGLESAREYWHGWTDFHDLHGLRCTHVSRHRMLTATRVLAS